MFKLSEAELDTMLMLWECGEPVRPAELLIRLNENGHTWSISTLQTLLARLLAKNAVVMTRQKRFHYYEPSVTREAFLAGTFTRLYGRLSTFSPISLEEALCNAKKLSEKRSKKALNVENDTPCERGL